MTVFSSLPFITVYKISLAITSANKGKIKGNKKQENNIISYVVGLLEMLMIIKTKRDTLSPIRKECVSLAI
ncbi:hypothetical protein D7V86_24695 [bacterium D16-51]|nr:hypothetical protein D7V96_25270 [bacterium D16-59]RKI53713.1 hypothetical protein D7V86_24695 [bacterium D16-51]